MTRYLIAFVLAVLSQFSYASQNCYGYQAAGSDVVYPTVGAACASVGMSAGATIDGSNYYCMNDNTISGTASFQSRACDNPGDPTGFCQSGQNTAGPITIPLPSLNSPIPSSFCDTRGVAGSPPCATNLTSSGGTTMRGCYDGGGCYATLEKHTGQQTGGTCDPNGVSSDSPLPPDPKEPTPPVTDPNAPPPGCTSITDPTCGPITTTPPGCKRLLNSSGTTVKEEIVCQQVTCGPSVCKTVTSTTTNNYNSSNGFRNGNPPDSSSTETSEKYQDKFPGGGSGSGSGTGSGGGTDSTSSSGLLDVNGDGFMDGDTNKDGTCDIGCGGSTSGGTGDSFCEENPNNTMCEKKGNCPDGSDTVGCMKPGEGTGEVGKADVNLSLKPSPVTFSGGGSCPAPASVSIGGHTVNLTNPGPICNTLSSIVRPIVLLLAAFAASMIIFKGTEI
jgi:hypothetical protein